MLVKLGLKGRERSAVRGNDTRSIHDTTLNLWDPFRRRETGSHSGEEDVFDYDFVVAIGVVRPLVATSALEDCWLPDWMFCFSGERQAGRKILSDTYCKRARCS